MPLDQTTLDHLAGLAESAARKAGAYIREAAQRDDIQVDTKAGGNTPASQVVTEVDEASQEIILGHLQASCASYGIAMLAEESTDNRERLEREQFWCIDPMDGTLCFVNGTPGYAVSIGLVARDGTPCIGIVYDPCDDILYRAVRNQGLQRNGEAWQPEGAVEKRPITVMADPSFAAHPEIDRILRNLEHMAIELGYAGARLSLPPKGAVMNACHILERGPACYFKWPKPEDGGGSLWDFAATACLFHEAGQVATDFHGDALDLNRHDATFMNHKGALYASTSSMAAAIRAKGFADYGRA